MHSFFASAGIFIAVKVESGNSLTSLTRIVFQVQLSLEEIVVWCLMQIRLLLAKSIAVTCEENSTYLLFSLARD